jgi:hypothetical protein
MSAASMAFMREHGVLKDVFKHSEGNSHKTARGKKITVHTSKAPGFGPQGIVDHYQIFLLVNVWQIIRFVLYVVFHGDRVKARMLDERGDSEVVEVLESLKSVVKVTRIFTIDSNQLHIGNINTPYFVLCAHFCW